MTRGDQKGLQNKKEKKKKATIIVYRIVTGNDFFEKSQNSMLYIAIVHL